MDLSTQALIKMIEKEILETKLSIEKINDLFRKEGPTERFIDQYQKQIRYLYGKLDILKEGKKNLKKEIKEKN